MGQSFGCYIDTATTTYPLAFTSTGAMRTKGGITVESAGMYFSKQSSLLARCKIKAVHVTKKSDNTAQHTALIETYNGTGWSELFTITVTADSVEFVGQPGEFGPDGIFVNGGFRVTLSSANIAVLVVHEPN